MRYVGSYFPDIEANPKTSRLPHVMFWAWERPEDLRFLGPHKQGVAFLARTIELRSISPGSGGVNDTGIELLPRLQPLVVDAETPLMAVVRIESSNDLWHQRGSACSASASAGAIHRRSARDHCRHGSGCSAAPGSLGPSD